MKYLTPIIPIVLPILVTILSLFQAPAKAQTDSILNQKFQSNTPITLPKKAKSNKTIMFIARRPTQTIFGDVPISTTDVGHTFVAILDYQNGKIIKYTTYGKYPDGLLTNNSNDYSDMTRIANGQDLNRLHFEELELDDYQLELIKNINSKEGYYDLFSSNCAHYMQRVMNVFYWYHNGIGAGTENPARYHDFFRNKRVIAEPNLNNTN